MWDKQVYGILLGRELFEALTLNLSNVMQPSTNLKMKIFKRLTQ